MPDGEYHLGAHTIVKRGDTVRLADGSLAGSVLTMDRALRNLLSLGLPLAEAARRCSTLPADYLGLADRGQLVPGAAADLVVLDAAGQIERSVLEGGSRLTRSASTASPLPTCPGTARPRHLHRRGQCERARHVHRDEPLLGRSRAARPTSRRSGSVATAISTACPGFVEFHLLKGPEREDHVLYASHTIWRSYADFEAWTRSEAFRAAHRECRRQQAALSRAIPRSRASR